MKLIDFGMAKAFGTPERYHSKNVTTQHYRAPEVLFGATHYGPSIDMWAVGCILNGLLLRQTLFPGTSQIDQLGKIFSVRGAPSNEDWPDVESLPNYLQFTIKEVKPLKSFIPFATPACLDLLDKLL